MNIFKTAMFAALAASPVLCAGNPVEAAAHFDGENRDLSMLNWSIVFDNLVANFTLDSDKEVILTYTLDPPDANYSAELYMADCASNITNIAITATKKLDPAGVLTVGYDFNKSQIAGSSIWNASTSEIEVCEVVQTSLANGYIIQEDKRVLTIDFDLNVQYNISGVGLAPETIYSNETDSDVNSYVKSCKCSKDSYACTTDPVAPNEEIYLCIYSISAAVGIVELQSMTIDQTSTKSPGTPGTVSVIARGDPVYNEITKETACAPGACGNDETGAAIEGEGVKVTTFMPISSFDYDTGTTVAATGTIDMEFVAAASKFSRRLSAGAGRKLEGSEPASYAMEIPLTPEEVTVEDAINSASAAGKGITGLALMYVIATAMW